MIYFIYQVQSQEICDFGRSLFNIVNVKLFFFLKKTVIVIIDIHLFFV